MRVVQILGGHGFDARWCLCIKYDPHTALGISNYTVKHVLRR